MSKIRSICIYCGSRTGVGDEYARLAESVGASIAAAGLTLVYGGGQVGLMGIAARAAIDGGGTVIGIIPEHLDTIEIAQTGLSELHVVADMHTRKRMMFDRSDAFLVLPGGLGSLDEFFEVLTWAQLDLHDKPILLLNHHEFWEPLMDLLRHVMAQGFAGESSFDLFTTVPDLDSAFQQLALSDKPRHAAHPDLL